MKNPPKQAENPASTTRYLQRVGVVVKSLAAVVLALSSLTVPAQANSPSARASTNAVLADSDCPAGMVRARVIGADAFERESACTGLARAHSFFVQQGFSPATDGRPITFRFESEVRIACSDLLEKVDCKGARVAAFFDAGKFEIVTTKASSAWMHADDRPYFKLRYDQELYVSVLAHEATHALSKQFYRYSSTTHAQDEYIAYASQLSTIDESIRVRILDGYPMPEFEFSSEFNINDLVHHGGPHAFGVMSWRHFTGPSGGRVMLDRIYSGDYQPPSLDIQ